ncbi:MAG TPA: hypothetical protein PLA19_04945, partial [Candidatus Pacearchaeota archaeon]|nr:hypothetical protein [Candidatus Pacearchaeota archaeon]
MKRYLPLFVFLPVSLSLFAYSWAQELPEIVINDADATTTIDLATPPADFFTIDNPPFLLPDEAAICHADAREVIDLATPPEEFFDASEADLRLSDEVAICRADKRLTIDLVAPPEEFFDSAPNFTDKFVYVALGDSYQSGEGAGNSIADTNDYLTKAYENGNNYSRIYNGTAVPQQNTYVKELVDERLAGEGNGCHRALQNYAKINKNKFHPELSDDDIVLIDLTCSGAKIETGDQPPIVGEMNSDQIASNSQLQQALDKLSTAGLTPADVDLVTVGMGGNDAGFAELVEDCVTSSLINKILDQNEKQYEGVKYIADNFATCENINKSKSKEAIKQLYDKEVWAQNKLLETFSQAKIMQLSYPNIIPDPETLGSAGLCGGIRKKDLDHLRKIIKEINGKITAAAETVRAAGNTRMKLINAEMIFGHNSLCPSKPEDTLANGIKEDRLNAEANRLLNKDNQGDVQSGAMIADLFKSYDQFKSYFLPPIDGGCAAVGLVKMNNAFDELVSYLGDRTQKEKIQSNLADSSPDEAQSIRFDRSMGLLHPNTNGQELIACNVKAVYMSDWAGNCPPPDTPVFREAVNNKPVTKIPINAVPGSAMHLAFGGFASHSTIQAVILSTPKNLGTVIADADGVIDTNITLPDDIGPGVHTIMIEGQAANGVGLTKQFLVNYPGNPTANSSYGIYLTGFIPNDGTAEPEKVDINYMGMTFETRTPDEAGGIFVEIPVLNQEEISITAKSQITGKEVVQIVDVIIDNTPPELTFSFDQTKKDLVFTATDDITDPDNIVITDQNAIVAATDQAGNTTKLVFNEKNRKQSLRAQLKSISYNDTTVNLSSNRIGFAWFYGYTPKIPAILSGLQSLPPIPANLPQSNTLKFLLQQARLKDGSFVAAVYANNKTRIVEYKNRKFNLKTYSGLKLLKFNT